MPEGREIRSAATIFLAYPASPALNALTPADTVTSRHEMPDMWKTYALKRIVFRTFRHDESGNARALAADVQLRNSKARHAGQYDDQKVTFYSKMNKRSIGEIEDRHDSSQHYREMKFRLNAAGVLKVLTAQYPNSQNARPQVLTHGRAIRLFK